MSTIGERILAERKAKRWSQTKLAGEVTRHSRVTGEEGISQSGVDKIEKRGDVTIRSPQAFALALGVQESWLRTGKGAKHALNIPMARGRAMVPVVGYIGAGAAVELVDAYPKGGRLKEVPCPRGLDPSKIIAVIVRGESQAPMVTDGWLIFYGRDPEPDTVAVMGRLCVVKIEDGDVLLKQVKRGAIPGKFNLHSVNAPMIEDVALEWAAPVRAMLPPEMAEEAAA